MMMRPPRMHVTKPKAAPRIKGAALPHAAKPHKTGASHPHLKRAKLSVSGKSSIAPAAFPSSATPGGSMAFNPGVGTDNAAPSPMDVGSAPMPPGPPGM